MVFDKIKRAYSGSLDGEELGNEYLELDLGAEEREAKKVMVKLFILKQYDDNNTFHQFKEIEMSESPITHFQMVSDQRPHGIKLAIPEGARVIHFYRNLRPAGQTEFQRSFIFGWRIKINGQTHKRLICIKPDDSIVLLDE